MCIVLYHWQEELQVNTQQQGHKCPASIKNEALLQKERSTCKQLFLVGGCQECRALGGKIDTEEADTSDTH
jgi:hypothetical protein